MIELHISALAGDHVGDRAASGFGVGPGCWVSRRPLPHAERGEVRRIPAEHPWQRKLTPVTSRQFHAVMSQQMSRRLTVGAPGARAFQCAPFRA